MLNISEDKLKLLLEQRKDKICKHQYDWIGYIISNVSLIITLILADFDKVHIILTASLWITAIIALTISTYVIVKEYREFYTIENLYSEIAEIDPTITHDFDIILLKNNNENGEYLVFKSWRWHCWLFLNYHCSEKIFDTDKERKYILTCIRRDLGILERLSLKCIKYTGMITSEKFSIPDRIIKKYRFHFFEVKNISIKKNKAFQYSGKKYKWMTLDQMYLDKNIVKKNADVLDYVRQNFGVN